MTVSHRLLINRLSMSRWLVAVLALLMSAAAHAVEPGEQLADKALEARARALSAELRCLVCQNQSIDDSSAPLAKDLRLLVREQIAAGRSDREVMAYVVARYGEFVLLRPRFTAETALLWLAPLLLLAAAGYALARRWRSQVASAPPVSAPLSPDEERRLRKLLDDTP